MLSFHAGIERGSSRAMCVHRRLGASSRSPVGNATVRAPENEREGRLEIRIPGENWFLFLGQLQFVDRAAMGEDVPPARWRLGMMPNTLAGACYLSVALTLVDREPIGICAEPSCRKIFFIEDGRQRFCTATCANRARFKRYKERHGGPAKAPKEGK